MPNSDFPTFFEKIRKRPGMYMGGKEDRSITAWSSFFLGFLMAEDFYQIPHLERLRGFNWPGFEQWLEKQYPEMITMHRIGSFEIARRMANSESEGFDLWCSWYDSYQSLKNKK